MYPLFTTSQRSRQVGPPPPTIVAALLPVLLCLLALVSTEASARIVIDGTRDTYPLTSSLSWLVDEGGELTIEKVDQSTVRNRFTRHREGVFKLGFISDPIWFHLPLQYRSANVPDGHPMRSAGKDWVLYIDYPHLDKIDVYYRYPDGEIVQQTVGDHQPFYQRPLRSTQYALPIALVEGQTVDVFLRLKTGSAVHMPISLMSKKGLLEKESVDRSLYGVYYGIMLVMVLYNLFIYVSFRDNAYLYYICHVLIYAVLQATLKGQAYEFLWPEMPTWNDVAIPTLVAISIFFGVQFVRHFLSTFTQLPLMDKWLKFNIILSLLLLVLTYTGSYAMAVRFSVLLTLLTTVIVISAGFISLSSGHRPARFFLAAWICLLPGASIYAMQVVNFIPQNFFTIHAGMIGSMLEVILLALALADRFNQMKQKSLMIEVKSAQQLKEANEQLSEALSKVEESNRLKDQFLAIVSHELRTPMNGVEGALDLISTQQLHTDQRRYIESAKISAREMTGLIDTILRFSEIQAGQVAVKYETFEVRSTLNLHASEYRRLCRQKQVNFDLQIDKSVPQFIEGDPEQIVMVLKQLVDNAIKFTEQGTITVYANLQPVPESDGKDIVFSVKDTGQGIARERLDKIFNAFHQLDAVSNRQSGLGIGLAICHRLVNMMGGRLEVHSEVGQGTIVKFHLPLRTPHADTVTEDVEELPLDDLSHKTVLIAEDNPVNQMVLKNMLQQLGCLILTANNGAQALELLNQQPVDLIMMDCQMPVMDGFEATRQIRSSLSAYRDTPIIAVTANAMSYDSGKCFAAGMNDYIKKPIHKDVVERKVRRWLNSTLLSPV